MPWFIKTEEFTQSTLNLTSEERLYFLEKHKLWVRELNTAGKKISSGYLVNEKRLPGGGGLLVFEANSFQDALALIKEDPMISNGLVTWNLQEWIPVSGKLLI